MASPPELAIFRQMQSEYASATFKLPSGQALLPAYLLLSLLLVLLLP